MAKFNEILVGRYNRMLQKLLGMKGGPPAAQLASEINANLQFPDLGNETRLFLGWYLYGLATFATAAATLNSFSQLRNPAASKVIAVVQKIVIAATAGASRYDVQYGQAGTDGAIQVFPRALDGRKQGSVTGSTIICSTGTGAGGQIGTNILFAQVALNNSFDLITYENQEIVLAPGDQVRVQDNTINENALISFFWRERALEEGELTA